MASKTFTDIAWGYHRTEHTDATSGVKKPINFMPSLNCSNSVSGPPFLNDRKHHIHLVGIKLDEHFSYIKTSHIKNIFEHGKTEY